MTMMPNGKGPSGKSALAEMRRLRDFHLERARALTLSLDMLEEGQAARKTARGGDVWSQALAGERTKRETRQLPASVHGRRYTDAEKAALVARLQAGEKVAALHRETGTAVSALRKWLIEAERAGGWHGSKRPVKPGRKPSRGGYTSKLRQQRAATAKLLARFSTEEPRPTAHAQQLAVMLRHGYLKRVEGGYLRTDKPFDVAKPR